MPLKEPEQREKLQSLIDRILLATGDRFEEKADFLFALHDINIPDRLFKEYVRKYQKIGYGLYINPNFL